MKKDILQTLKSGNKVFLSGCGATGRLSISLEVFWRETCTDPKLKDSVLGFMAGGDTALIKAIEGFEDHPEYAERQMKELGFKDGDILIATTEGGETSWVIGTSEYAAVNSKMHSWFLYCNPDDILVKNVERSKRVIQNPKINKINLTTGHQGLSGSTRMQASTVLMYAVGLALFSCVEEIDINAEIGNMKKLITDTDYSFLEKTISTGSSIYKNGNYVLYETNKYGITILTDSTERSPTFSLVPFENQNDSIKVPSWCFICLPEVTKNEESWAAIYHRQPIPLNWKEHPNTSSYYMNGFDFSINARENRKKAISGKELFTFKVWKSDGDINFQIGDLCHKIKAPKFILSEHTLLKCIMNTHSTILMGRMGRYQNNIMTWVRPTNNKLIDRAIRYVDYLLKQSGVSKTYDEICYELFEEIEVLKMDQSIVLNTFNRIKKQ